METTKRQATPQQLQNLAKARATRAANKLAKKTITAPTQEDVKTFGTPERSMSRDKVLLRNVYDQIKCKGRGWRFVCREYSLTEPDARKLLQEATELIQAGTLYMD